METCRESPLLGTGKVKKERLWRRAFLFMGLSWATWRGLIYQGLRGMVERGSGGGASQSVGARRREPGGRAPLLGTLKDR
jgi:hypothetical protein